MPSLAFTPLSILPYIDAELRPDTMGQTFDILAQPRLLTTELSQNLKNLSAFAEVTVIKLDE